MLPLHRFVHYISKKGLQDGVGLAPREQPASMVSMVHDTTNRSYFYRRLPLAKHMLLAFALKETCQTLSSSFNCLIRKRKDFLRNQQARTATWKKPRAPLKVHWEVGPKASQRRPEGGERSFLAQVPRKVGCQPSLDKGFWAFSGRERGYEDVAASSETESPFVQLYGAGSPPRSSSQVLFSWYDN